MPDTTIQGDEPREALDFMLQVVDAMAAGFEVREQHASRVMAAVMGVPGYGGDAPPLPGDRRATLLRQAIRHVVSTRTGRACYAAPAVAVAVCREPVGDVPAGRICRGSPSGWGGTCGYCGFGTEAVACPRCGLWSGTEYSLALAAPPRHEALVALEAELARITGNAAFARQAADRCWAVLEPLVRTGGNEPAGRPGGAVTGTVNASDALHEAVRRVAAMVNDGNKCGALAEHQEFGDEDPGGHRPCGGSTCECERIARAALGMEAPARR